MADARATTNRGTILPAIANLMNPVEPAQSAASEHQRNTRAEAYQQQPNGNSSYNYSNLNNGNQSYGPSFSALGSGVEQRFQNSKLPSFGDSSTRSHSVQLAPISTLTANLPPPNGTPGTYSPYSSGSQTPRADLKFPVSEQHYQSARNREEYGSLAGAMAPPMHQNGSSNGWKDPTSMSSSSSATSSTKSASTSPQPNWGRSLSSQGSSENVHGRSYSVAMDYMFPNDDKEHDRLDLSHKIYLLLMKGALHWAPIGNGPKMVLDIGTGTGIWAIDMAEKYPNSTIIGVDVMNMQPARAPRNAFFQTLDAESTWPWTEKFDYIHTRCLAGCIENWPTLYTQAFHNLKPGGYIELQEYSTEVCSPDPNICPRASGSTIAHWADLFNEASTLSGRPPGSVVTRNIKRDLLAAGFVDVRQEVLMLPLGMWHPRREMKELGGYALLNMLDGVEGFTLRLFTKYLGWTEAQCQQLIEDVRKEFKKGTRFYTAQYIVWGRKPVVGEIVSNGQGSRSPPSVKDPYPANGPYYYQ